MIKRWGAYLNRQPRRSAVDVYSGRARALAAGQPGTFGPLRHAYTQRGVLSGEVYTVPLSTPHYGISTSQWGVLSGEVYHRSH